MKKFKFSLFSLIQYLTSSWIPDDIQNYGFTSHNEDHYLACHMKFVRASYDIFFFLEQNERLPV